MTNRRGVVGRCGIIAVLLLWAAPVAAQVTTTGGPAQVMILGTYHMAGSGDYLAGSPDDILSEQRQNEVQDLVETLASFRPTKISVEVPLARDSAMNAHYQRYVAGQDTLSRSEHEQIGFRLGQLLGHRRLYAIDYQLDEDIGRVVAWAAEHGDTAFVNFVEHFQARMQHAVDSAGTLSLKEILRWHNSAEYDALHSAYLRMARVGNDSVYVGADVVAGRYERNLKIFANLARIAVPGDRLLVIYGSSHGKLLRDFVRESDDFELVHPDTYLKETPPAGTGP